MNRKKEKNEKGRRKEEKMGERKVNVQKINNYDQNSQR